MLNKLTKAQPSPGGSGYRNEAQRNVGNSERRVTYGNMRTTADAPNLYYQKIIRFFTA